MKWRHSIGPASMILVFGLAWPAWARATQDLPDVPLRSELPFSILPQRLPGPPRAMGEVPIGDTQPPSTLPGRLFGPPRASGEAPDRVLPLPSNMATPFVRPTGPMSPTEPSSSARQVPSIAPLPTTSASDLFLRSPAGADVLGGRRLGDPDLASRAPADESLKPRGPALTIDEVLSSALRTYPPYLAAFQEVDVARGELLSARGAFDLNFNSDGRNWGLGNYRRYLYDVFLEQPTTYWGTKFFAGYRLGVGDWPIYYQYLQTLPGGALVAGFETPLLRNGRIDAKRAKIIQSRIELRKVEPMLAKQRIGLVKDVTKAHVYWWAAGKRLEVVDALARTAEERDRGLARQVELGSLAPIDRADSIRVVIQRQGQRVYAKRRLQQSAIDLSLYLRDQNGFPWIPDDRGIPELLSIPAPPTAEQLQEDIEVALRLRPEIRSIRLQWEKANVERQLAENQQLPSLNFYVFSEKNLGPSPDKSIISGTAQTSKNEFILETSLLLDVPLQRRAARGQIAVAMATLRQLRIQERFAADRIVAEVRDDYSALQATYQQLELYRKSTDVNRRLEDAERRKFALGNSTVLALALREQATADALIYELDATAEYLRAIAEYRAALAADIGTLVQP